MKKIKLTLFLLLIILFSVSCNDWLNVTPETDIKVASQIKTPEGYKEMLNGVYIGMAQRGLYGEHLMYGDIEYLAQNNEDSNNSNPLSGHAYDDASAIGKIDGFWEGLYSVISNCNIILDHIDDSKEIFNHESDYNIIKGEALALRAFLHFDVLRLFGEPYPTGMDSRNTQIPYVRSAEVVRYAHLTMELVYERILADLDEAASLLALSDPLIAPYDGYFFPVSNRVYHLNLYAVQALKARVYLSMQDYEQALVYANSVIEKYDWTFKSDDIDDDVLLSTELISALQVYNLGTIYSEGAFGASGHRSANGDYDAAGIIFEVDELISSINGEYILIENTGVGISDTRYFLLMGPDGSGEANTTNATTIKYNQAGLAADLYDYPCVPLFRVTEMLLIKAECELALNYPPQGAIDILTEIKANRGYFPNELDLKDSYADYDNIAYAQGVAIEQAILDDIVKEYRKELFLEGQTFYLFKRLGLTTIINGSELGYIDMTTAMYILPLPFNETELGNHNSN